MLPDNPFTGALPPFAIPVPVPDNDPFVEPFYTAMWNVEWTPYILGALTSLTLQATWKTDDPAVLWLAQRRAMSLLAGISAGYPGERPFWETEDDLDDETLPEAPWYEKISDWIITAFLAVTFTPDAAIVYNSTIPRMRLVFRSGDLGATVRVLIDGVEALYESLYSETPGIVERIVEAVPTEGFRGLLGTEPPYVLRIEKADSDPDTKLEVVLGDIRPEDGSEVQFRQLEHCPLEFSSDGGGTWIEIYSAADCVVDGINEAIANDTIATPADIEALGRATPPDTTEPSYGYLCAGIKAVVDKVEDYLDAVLAAIDLSKETMAIISDIAALTVVGDVAVNDILALIADSTAAGTAAIRAAKGANSLDELKKELYCLAKADGGFFVETFNDWRASDVGANIWKIAMIEASKAVSWAEWATVYAVAATNEDNSCEAGYDCGWCYEFDFTIDDQDWAAWVYSGQSFGHYYTGLGWRDDYPTDPIDGLVISPPAFDEAEITSVQIDFSGAWGGDSPIIDLETYEHDTQIKRVTTTGTTVTITPDTPQTLTRFTLWFDPYLGNQAHMSVYVTKIRVRGLGTNPFGDSNCEA